MRTPTLLVVCLFWAVASLAQSPWSAGVNLQAGFAGSNQTNLNSSEFRGTQFTTAREGTLMPAFGGGGWTQFQLYRSLGLRLGVNYLNTSNREHRTNYTDALATGQRTTTAQYNYELRIQQLNIPLEVVYEPKLGKLHPHFSVGIQSSYDWHGTISEQSSTATLPNINRIWTPYDRTISRPKPFLYQPIASIGLRFNEQLTLRVRHTWSPPRNIIWTENNAEVYQPYTPGIYFCGNTTTYHTASSHNRLTSIQFSYRIF